MTITAASDHEYQPLAPGTLEEHGPACGHPTRYRALSGRILCELCERLRTGWGLCPLCGHFEPLTLAWYSDDDVRICARCDTDDGEGLF